MLDTNIVSALMRAPQNSIVRSSFDAVEPKDVCLSIITTTELKFGFAKRPSPRIAQQLEALFSVVRIVPFAEPADQVYAEIRTHLERAGTPIGPHDLLIAAHALALDLTLVTDNLREFSRVPDLRVENWLD
jgi:tRNA(fMet)-specific endonuclease VapC